MEPTLQTVVPAPQVYPHKKFPIILTIILSALTGAGIYAGIQWYLNQPHSFGEMNSILTSSSEESAWKTYTNSQHGFEFQYPGDMVAKGENVTDAQGASYFMLKVGRKEQLDFICDGCDAPPADLLIFYSQTDTNPVLNCSKPPEGEISRVTIGGIVGDKCVYDGLSGPNNNIYLFRDRVNLFDIRAYNYSGKQKILIDQILATFKFF